MSSTSSIPTHVSTPPAEWVEPAKLGIKGRRPKNGLPLRARALANELRKNAAALREELGPKAVDPEQLAAALETACDWDGVTAKAATFHLYTRVHRGSSWNAAMTLLGGLRLGVVYALSRDATFADRFPTVAKVFAKRRYRTKKSARGTATPATASEP